MVFHLRNLPELLEMPFVLLVAAELDVGFVVVVLLVALDFLVVYLIYYYY